MPAAWSARRSAGLLAVAAVLLVLTSVALSHAVGWPEGAERVVVVPAGTAARLAAGEDVALIPDDLRFRLRDRLVVVNEDVVEHQIGPLTVAPGERLEKRFSEAASTDAYCSLHPGGRVSIEVARA